MTSVAVASACTVALLGTVLTATTAQAEPSTTRVGRSAPALSVPSETGPVFPSAATVAKAKAEAAATATAVDHLAKESAQAEATLLALQAKMSQAVAADQAAPQELDERAAAVAKAEAALAKARAGHAAAGRAVAHDAAVTWQQGGTISGMSLLLSSDPTALLDLQTVLDARAREVSQHLAAASAAAALADQQRALLDRSRAQQASATATAKQKQQVAKALADSASAQAAALSAQQLATEDKLAQLQAQATKLAQQRTAGLAAQEAARKAAEAAAKARAAAQAKAAREAARKAAAARASRGSSGGGATSGGSSGYSGGSSGSNPQAIARSMMGNYGWGSNQFSCLVDLWNGESGWNWAATNPYSGAYGIPQSLPAWKMASAGSDWLTNPATQIRWGMGYIKAVYGSPCNAWSRWLSRSPHWY
ncbi:MAG: hypothetical protein ACK5MP_02750 [Nostocoides sp.]